MNALPAVSRPWFPSLRWLDRVDGQIAILTASAAMMLAGLVTGSPWYVGAGGAGLCLVARAVERVAFSPRAARLASLATSLFEKCGRYDVAGRVTPQSEADKGVTRPVQAANDPAPALISEGPQTIESTTDLVAAMTETRRYALLLRPESSSHLSEEQRRQAAAALDEHMAVVPAGTVLTGLAAERATLGHETDSLPAKIETGGIATVDACYLDRRPVTNAEFQQFVDSGGYEQLDLWPEEALPALFDFVDQTGESGPRYWTHQEFEQGEDDLPVVGISWYEASAYAHWVGKRLPSDAEWTKACAWPIESAPGRIAQRRYPWGESFEPHRANLWCSGPRCAVAVQEYTEGITVGGLEQMVGNVWEWTLTPLQDATPKSVRFPNSLRSIRGGAFDTYFENQATCHFQSGEHPLARRQNIGLRLALSMSTLVGG